MSKVEYRSSYFCPLCFNQTDDLVGNFSGRIFYKCKTCLCVFLLESNWLSHDDELSFYRNHINSPEDPSYRKFLSQVSVPLAKKLLVPSIGLDFGSGPGPTLSFMLAELGHKVALYDPFFAPNLDSLNAKYDFITMTEVAEHLRRPMEEFKKLRSLLLPGGILIVMTKRCVSNLEFGNWYYKNDPTHIIFYTLETFLFLGKILEMAVEMPSDDVAIFSLVEA